MWTIETALEFIREQQPRFKEVSFHLALAGSVLNNGKSEHDLDIIVMSMGTQEDISNDNLLNLLASLDAIPLNVHDEEYEEDKIIYRSFEKGKQIDWFVYGIAMMGRE